MGFLHFMIQLLLICMCIVIECIFIHRVHVFAEFLSNSCHTLTLILIAEFLILLVSSDLVILSAVFIAAPCSF